jgi:hypothetical protein
VEVLGIHNLAADLIVSEEPRVLEDLIAGAGVRELLFVAGLELGFE